MTAVATQRAESFWVPEGNGDWLGPSSRASRAVVHVLAPMKRDWDVTSLWYLGFRISPFLRGFWRAFGSGMGVRRGEGETTECPEAKECVMRATCPWRHGETRESSNDGSSGECEFRCESSIEVLLQ